MLGGEIFKLRDSTGISWQRAPDDWEIYSRPTDEPRLVLPSVRQPVAIGPAVVGEMTQHFDVVLSGWGQVGRMENESVCRCRVIDEVLEVAAAVVGASTTTMLFRAGLFDVEYLALGQRPKGGSEANIGRSLKVQQLTKISGQAIFEGMDIKPGAPRKIAPLVIYY